MSDAALDDLGGSIADSTRLELARIEAAMRRAEQQFMLDRAGIVAQGRSLVAALAVVGAIVLLLGVGSLKLAADAKEIPAFIPTTVSIAITGLVGMLSYSAGHSKGQQQQQSKKDHA